MSGAFKKALIVGGIGAVIGIILYAIIGGREVLGFLGLALIFFAIFLLIGYIVTRIVSRGRDDDEYEYED